MKKFIALDVKEYKLKKGIIPVNLTWKNNTIKDWCNKLKINNKDIIIGHSLGAAIALIVAKKTPPKELHLYSPSPIFTETIKYLDDKNLKYFGKKRLKEIKIIPKVTCPVTIYVGGNEDRIMKLTAKKICASLPHAKLIIIPNKDHSSVIRNL